MRRTLTLALAVVATVAIALAPIRAEAQYYGLTNVAKGQPVTALTAVALGGPPSVITDGMADTYWYSYPTQEYIIDLGSEIPIGKIVVSVLQASSPVISSSTDGITFTQRHSANFTDASHSNWIGGMAFGPLVFEANGTYSARYLRYRSDQLGSGSYQGTQEFAVFPWVATPPPVLSGTNLTTLPGTSVTGLLPSAPGFLPSNVIDGDPNTLWTGAHLSAYTPVGGQQFYSAWGQAEIDLGVEQLAYGARVRRPAAGGAQVVSVQLFNNLHQEIAWFGYGDPTVVGTTNPALGDADFVLDAPVPTRYVRITQINPTVSTPTAQPTLAEVEVYGAVSAATFTITASAGPNGTISPSGAVTVPSGGSQTFAITPDPGFHVADVLVDGSSVGAVMSYPFAGVTANHTIAASFAQNFTVARTKDQCKNNGWKNVTRADGSPFKNQGACIKYVEENTHHENEDQKNDHHADEDHEDSHDRR